MSPGLIIAALVMAYLLGAFPAGLIIVRVFTGRDIRNVASGRTGGTNAMRAGGFLAGVGTGILDVLKAALAIYIVRALNGSTYWLEVFAGLMTIIGHNYSIFLMERDGNKVRLRGGAGGGPTIGAALAMWPPSLLFTASIMSVMLFGVGYASLATMSIAITAAILFSIRALGGIGPWEYVVFGILAEFILIWALRPNIIRLAKGEERLVGWRARKKRTKAKASQSDDESQRRIYGD